MLESSSLFEIDPGLAKWLASGIEAMHTYSLVHDDLPAMDNDDLRRGRPTVHKKWDVATAILVGDALQALSFELTLKNVVLIQIACLQFSRFRCEGYGNGASFRYLC